MRCRMTSTTQLALQFRLPQQIGCANNNFNYSSQLETSRERALNYSATSSTWSTTSQNQLRLVGFIDKLPMDQSYASPPTFCATHTLSIIKLATTKPCPDWFEAAQPRTLSALEENLDHLPTTRRRRSHHATGGYCFRQLLGFSCSYDPESGKGIRLVRQVWTSEGHETLQVS
jgi:hypothetical protein